MKLLVKQEGPYPLRQPPYPSDAGMDIPVAEDTDWISPGQHVDVSSGIKVAIPEGYYGRIIGRSSTLRKRNLQINEGIIDAGFRGELKTYVTNLGSATTMLRAGEYVAQLLLCKVPKFTVRYTVVLPESERGESGFGSTEDMLTRRTRLNDALAHQIAADVPAALAADADTLAKLAMNASYGKAEQDLRYQAEHGHPPVANGLDTPIGFLQASGKVVFKPLRVYLGGPIDKGSDVWRMEWINMLRAALGCTVRDPKLAASGMTDEAKIVQLCMDQMDDSDFILFNLSDGARNGAYGFGSPIEIAYATEGGRRPIIVLGPGHNPGVYLRFYWRKGAILVESLAEAIQQMKNP